MNDRDSFLRAILAAPDDDVPRLIFADWLDENGEPERAEFIRVQCELAGLREEASALQDIIMPAMPSDILWKGKPCSSEQFDRLWRAWYLIGRERDLLLPGEFHFAQPIPNLLGWTMVHQPGEFDWTFRRGFVEEIACSWEDWARPTRKTDGSFTKIGERPNERLETMADAIRAATPLKTVRLTTRLPGGFGGEPFDNEMQKRILAHDWPGIEFELPAETQWEERQPGIRAADYFQEMSVPGLNPRAIFTARTE